MLKAMGSHRTGVAVIMALVMISAVPLLFSATESEATEGESIEYRYSSSNWVVIYDSPALDALKGQLFTATVIDSESNSYASDTKGGPFFAAIDDFGCVITLNSALTAGKYDVLIMSHGNTIYDGPLIVGDVSLVIDVSEIAVGQTVSFDDMLSANPSDIAADVKWSSSDNGVLRITNDGVEAAAVGDATITATYEYIGGDVTVSKAVTVTPIKVTNATIAGESEVSVGGTVDLTLSVGSGVSGYTVEWSAVPSDAVTIIPSEGAAKVTASKTGSVTITATITNYDKTTVKAEHVLIVKPIPVTSVSITSEDGMKLGIGGSIKLEYEVNPSDATNKAVTWSSSDDNVATVGADGVITGTSAGNVTITVASVDDPSITDTYALTVTNVPVTGVTLDKTEMTLAVGSDATLKATVNPATASNTAVTWLSSDAGVVSVINGKLTAVKAGEATITVTTVDGSHTATCAVTVIEGYTVSFNITGEGEVKPAGPLAVKHGESVTFSVVPGADYDVRSVICNGQALNPENGVYTVSNVTSDLTVSVVFVHKDVPVEPDKPGTVYPPIDEDDELPILPPVNNNGGNGNGKDDDKTTVVACAAAAVVAVLIAVFLIVEHRKR